MSGLTLAAGTRPVGGEAAGKAREDGVQGGMLGGIMGSLRIIELQLVAFIVVFAASGLVPVLDVLFPVVISGYCLFLATFVFPMKEGGPGEREVFHGSRMFQAYVVLGSCVGLFLPLAYVLGGFARGDQSAVRAATPHLFLLSAQVLSENVVSSMGIWSPPVRAILTILYTGRRLFTLFDWLAIIVFRTFPPPNPWIQDVAWLWFGRALTLANLAYYLSNFFFFLIPRFLSRAFERYIKAQDMTGPVLDHKKGQ